MTHKFLVLRRGKTGRTPREHMVLDPDPIRTARNVVLAAVVGWAVVLGLGALVWWALWRVV